MKLTTEAILVLGMATLTLFFAISCGPQRTSLHTTAAAVTSAANAGYGLAVEICATKERAIVDRPGTSEDLDDLDLAEVRKDCDAVYAVFEAVRTRQADLKRAVDALEPVK